MWVMSHIWMGHVTAPWVRCERLRMSVNDTFYARICAWMTHSTHVYVRGTCHSYLSRARSFVNDYDSHSRMSVNDTFYARICARNDSFHAHICHSYLCLYVRRTYVLHIWVYMCAHMSFISESICAFHAHVSHTHTWIRISVWLRYERLVPRAPRMCLSRSFVNDYESLSHVKDLNDTFHAHICDIPRTHMWLRYDTFHAHMCAWIPCDSDMTHCTHEHVTQIWHIPRTHMWLRYEWRMCVGRVVHIWVTYESHRYAHPCVCVWNESCVHAYVRARTDSFRCVYLHVCGIRHVYILMCVVIGLFCKRDP